jgi:hypothetical protein
MMYFVSGSVLIFIQVMSKRGLSDHEPAVQSELDAASCSQYPLVPAPAVPEAVLHPRQVTLSDAIIFVYVIWAHCHPAVPRSHCLLEPFPEQIFELAGPAHVY